MKTKMNGNQDGAASQPLQVIFDKQIDFQMTITGLKTLPQDQIEWYKYHMLAIIEELGEILVSDKRWKTHRNEKLDLENKLEEIADMFITAVNIAIFSGFNAQDINDRILKKIEENTAKLQQKEIRHDCTTCKYVKQILFENPCNVCGRNSEYDMWELE